MDVEEFKLWSHLADICGYFSCSLVVHRKILAQIPTWTKHIKLPYMVYSITDGMYNNV